MSYFLNTPRSTKDIPDSRFMVNRVNLNHGCYQYSINRDGKPIPYLTGLEYLENDSKFRSVFIKALKDTPFNSYVWEMPPIRYGDTATPFEFVISESRGLSGKEPNTETFSKHFYSSLNQYVTSFLNLGGDAKLISPLPRDAIRSGYKDYSHMAAFMKNAPEVQIDEFVKAMGYSMKDMVEQNQDTPLWLSTAGHGVAWLHARIDSTPKYYSHQPYKSYLQAGKKGRRSNMPYPDVRSTSYVTDEYASMARTDTYEKDGWQETFFPSQTSDNKTRKRGKETKIEATDAAVSNKRDYSIQEGFYNHGQTMTYYFMHKNQIVTYKDALTRLKCDPTFQGILYSTIKGCQHKSFAMEIVPVTKKTYSTEKFEFVCINTDRYGQENLKANDTLDFNKIFLFNNDEKVITWIEPHDDSLFLIPNPLYRVTDSTSSVTNNEYSNGNSFLVDPAPMKMDTSTASGSDTDASRKRGSTQVVRSSSFEGIAKNKSRQRKPESGKIAEAAKYSQMSEFFLKTSEENRAIFWKLLAESIIQKMDENPYKHICVTTNVKRRSMVSWAYARIDYHTRNYMHTMYQKKGGSSRW